MGNKYFKMILKPKFDAGEIFDLATPPQLDYLRRLSPFMYHEVFSYFVRLKETGVSYEEIIYNYFKTLSETLCREDLYPWTRQIPKPHDHNGNQNS
jgi:hypothetical protein